MRTSMHRRALVLLAAASAVAAGAIQYPASAAPSLGVASTADAPAAPSAVPPDANVPFMDLSDAVVYGKITSATTVDGTMSGVPVDTLYSIKVAKTAKGPALPNLTLRVHGGWVANLNKSVDLSSEPDVSVGEDAMFFLTRLPDGTFKQAVSHDLSVIPSVIAAPNGATEHNTRYDADPATVTVAAACENTGSESPMYSGYTQMQNSSGSGEKHSSGSWTFVFNSNASGFQQYVASGMGAWNSQDSALSIQNGGTTSAEGFGWHGGTNVISAENHPEWDSSTGDIQAETENWSESSGLIDQVNIVFNTQLSSWDTTPNWVRIATHELGHSEGMGHAPGDAAQIMNPCPTVNTPGWGDLAGESNITPENQQGYYLLKSNGAVYTLGGVNSWFQVNAPFYGAATGSTSNATDIALHMPTRAGYWILGGDGGIFTEGDTRFYGSAAGHVSGTAVAMSPTPTGGGYIIGATDGGVFTFGDAPFFGSCASPHCFPTGASGAGIAMTADGQGYWVLDTHGDIYTFGDARYFGGTIPPTSYPAKSIKISSTGNGYYILGADGGVFTFGDAAFQGSSPTAGGEGVRQFSRDPLNNDYAFVASDGNNFRFGVQYYGRGNDCSCYAAMAVTERPIPPDWSMSVAPSSLVIQSGQCGTGTVAMTSNNAFYSTINLSASGQPSGVSATLSPSSVTLAESGAASSTVTICAPAQTLQLSSYSFTENVNGYATNFGTSRSGSISVTVVPAPILP